MPADKNINHQNLLSRQLGCNKSDIIIILNTLIKKDLTTTLHANDEGKVESEMIIMMGIPLIYCCFVAFCQSSGESRPPDIPPKLSKHCIQDDSIRTVSIYL